MTLGGLCNSWVPSTSSAGRRSCASTAQIELGERFGEKPAKLAFMEKVFQAVYKDGVLLPEEPLPLEDMQRVTVTINLPASDGDVAGYFTTEEWAAAAVDPITWDDAQQALAGISGPCLTPSSPKGKSANCQTASSIRARSPSSTTGKQGRNSCAASSQTPALVPLFLTSPP